MRIRNAKDLARYWGCAPTEKSISRAVYKGTVCGAWAHLEQDAGQTVYQEFNWKVDIRNSILGPFVYRARRTKGRKWYTPDEFPEELVDWLCGIEFKNGRWFLVDEEAIQIVKDNPLKGRRYWDASYRAPKSRKPVPGVSFGSIVEGVEETTTVHTVAFPCDSEDIGKAIQAVEDEAREIWDRTHGCEGCWNEVYVDVCQELEFPGWPINPDCPSCKGEGTVL